MIEIFGCLFLWHVSLGAELGTLWWQGSWAARALGEECLGASPSAKTHFFLLQPLPFD
ncbi:unnamed protein product [Prunus armeniaca]|uniref:Uncharacterized protein n=1 Tax=Prunus armeniaca TaxID=36596 RepID=A0A6J5Y8J0_PRUAR|nr:unnamed protein product [Prunus armeniaca]